MRPIITDYANHSSVVYSQWATGQGDHDHPCGRRACGGARIVLIFTLAAGGLRCAGAPIIRLRWTIAGKTGTTTGLYGEHYGLTTYGHLSWNHHLGRFTVDLGRRHHWKRLVVNFSISTGAQCATNITDLANIGTERVYSPNGQQNRVVITIAPVATCLWRARQVCNIDPWPRGTATCGGAPN